MVEQILSKQKTNSELIGKLINNFESYSRKLEEKMKINHIFHDFDEHLRKDLNLLVKLSNDRYKSVKSGNKVIKIINKQKDKINTLMSSVANDELYKSEDIYEEKKMLNQLPVKNTEIINIRQKLKDIQQTQGINPYLVQNMNSNRDHAYNQVKTDMDYLNILNYEKNNINGMIETYTNFLNELKGNPSIREDLYKKKFAILPESLQFLNFKENLTHNVEKKAVQSELIDMQKLLNLAKSKRQAKQQYFENRKKQNYKTRSSSELIQKEYLLAPKKENLQIFVNTMIPQNNPISMIKSGIAKSVNIVDNLKDKNENITSTVGEIKLPQIEEYQKLISKFLNAKKLVQMTSEGSKSDKNYVDLVKDKRKFKKDENLNNNFLTEIKKIKRKPNTYIDDYSKREFMNEKLSDLNSYLIEKNQDKSRLNHRIDEYLVNQERKLAVSLQQNHQNFEQEMKRKNRVADNFKKRFINNLHDPSFDLDEEDLSTKDLELVEKSSFIRVQATSQNLEENYNEFKNFKESLLDKEKEKSNSFIIIDEEKQSEKELRTEFKVKNSSKFQKFTNFINNNDTQKILRVIKDTSSMSKNANIFDRSNTSQLELPIIVNKNRKVEESKGKNLMYNLNLNTNPNESIELYEKI